MVAGRALEQQSRSGLLLGQQRATSAKFYARTIQVLAAMHALTPDNVQVDPATPLAVSAVWSRAPPRFGTAENGA